MPKVSYLLIIVGWLIFIASLIIPRLIFKQPISTIATIPTIATDATNADIINAIYSLQNAVNSLHSTVYSVQSNLQNTIYRAMGIEIMVLTTVVVVILSAILTMLSKK